MKIQFGEKSDVSWDVLIETLKVDDLEDQQEWRSQTCFERVKRQCCGGSWLTLAFVVSVVTITQVLLFLYLLSTWNMGSVTHLVFTDDHGRLRHIHFSWTNCGSKSDPIQLNQLQVKPDPVMLNGNITLNLNAYLDRYLDAPISATVKVERRVGWFWVTVPCFENMGSCHYRNMCDLTPYVPPEPCPDPFPKFGLPCRCPVSKGQYKVKEGMFSIPALVNKLPAWLVSGDYYIRGISYKDGHSLGCYSFYVSVSH